MDEFRKELENKIKGLIPDSVILGTVKEVDKANLSCTVTESKTGIDIFDVRLAPGMGIASKTVITVPTKGSLVLVGLMTKEQSAAYLVMCQECDEIILNGGAFGGLIKIDELKDQMQKDSEILQTILNVINGVPLTQAANAPSVLQATLNAQLRGKQPGDYSNIENKKVTHG